MTSVDAVMATMWGGEEIEATAPISLLSDWVKKILSNAKRSWKCTNISRKPLNLKCDKLHSDVAGSRVNGANSNCSGYRINVRDYCLSTRHSLPCYTIAWALSKNKLRLCSRRLWIMPPSRQCSSA